jgi:hypothetical protein
MESRASFLAAIDFIVIDGSPEVTPTCVNVKVGDTVLISGGEADILLCVLVLVSYGLIGFEGLEIRFNFYFKLGHG